MAENAVVQGGGGDAPAAPAGEGENQQGQSFFGIAKGLVVRALIIYFISSFFRKAPSEVPEGTDLKTGATPAAARIAATNVYADNTRMELFAYISDLEDVSEKFPDTLVWHKNDLIYGDWTSGPDGDGVHSMSTTIKTSQNLRNNGSMYLHTYLVRAGNSPNPSSKSHHKLSTVHVSHRLNRYMKKRYRKTANLITGKTDKTEEEIKKAETIKEEIASHWHPNFTINVVHDFTPWTPGMVPAPLQEFVQFTPAFDRYKPILFVNTFWSLVKDYQLINKTNTELNLTLTFQPLSLFKWQLYAAQTAKNKWGAAGGLLDGLQGSDDEEDNDALKEAILETSPVLLGLTMAVSILHSVFEFLAFKNDIQFWNNRQSLEGLSVRSVFFNVFQSIIVLLYVCDNETNFVIKVSCFVGLLIELWKITKVMDVSINKERRIMGVPTLKFTDKGTYIESSTRQYDQMAFRYLGVALFPMLAAYCGYSLFYYEHKGWYSFVLSMLYGFLLTFGFIMMTPQLFINYKLKSVAHLPWRMLTYKALNTFIDDIFAFVIKMPTMYRIGCLRDDVIFFIFLYQRYIYRIDPTRMNEFGFSQEMEQDASKKQQQPSITDSNDSGGAVENSNDASTEKSPQEKKKD